MCPIFLDFQRFLIDDEAQQCKLYASMMKSNLLNAQGFYNQVLWPDLNNIR